MENSPQISSKQIAAPARSPMLLTGTYDGMLISWDTSDKIWKTNQEIPPQKFSINRLAISEDGLIAGAATSSGVILYRLPNLDAPITIEEKSNVTSIFFQIQQNIFYYSTENGELFFYDTHYRSKTLLYQNDNDINCAELSPNQSEIYFGDSFGNVKVIQIKQAILKYSMCGNKNAAIRSLAVSPICSILAAGDSLGELYWWSLSENDVNLKGRNC